ncbi:hypothetical protein DFH06DRAFT_524832 [Mycena polygramma]|nr:hypothetical protein DFH06DRAFT_524832 [Mycena polygramma]
MLAADRARLTEIDAEILDLERSVSQSPLEETISGDMERSSLPPMNTDIRIRELELRAEKALVQERLDSYKFPVLTLPTEIVSEIFTHSLPPYPLCPPLWGSLSPTKLTHICREWRYIALATPALWRAVPVSITGAAVEWHRHMLDLWLKRSCYYPLSIRLQRFNSSDLLLSSLVSHRARWDCLKITALTASALAKFIEGPLPLLRHLDINLATRSSDVLDFAQAPRLRTVDLNGPAVSNITLPWLQLTCLTLHRVAPRDCASILQHTSNLVHCVLDFWSVYHWNVVDITLPHLESLHFHPNSDAEPQFLNALVTPSLRTLQIHQEFFATSPIHLLASFVSKSDCKLQEVTIYTNGDRPETVPEESYRRAFPSIPRFILIALA